MQLKFLLPRSELVLSTLLVAVTNVSKAPFLTCWKRMNLPALSWSHLQHSSLTKMVFKKVLAIEAKSFLQPKATANAPRQASSKHSKFERFTTKNTIGQCAIRCQQSGLGHRQTQYLQVSHQGISQRTLRKRTSDRHRR